VNSLGGGDAATRPQHRVDQGSIRRLGPAQAAEVAWNNASFEKKFSSCKTVTRLFGEREGKRIDRETGKKDNKLEKEK
jgi:hypothetical protein